MKKQNFLLENTEALHAVSEAEEAKAEEAVAEALSAQSVDDMDSGSDMPQEEVSSEELPAQSL